MRNLKELKTLLCDPLKFYYDLGHKIASPYTEDPLKERLTLCYYEIESLKQSLYFKEIEQLDVFLDPLSKMAKEALMGDLEEENRYIKEQLKFHQLNKKDLFSVEILDHLQEPFFKQKVHFYPKNTLIGNIPVVSHKGVLVNKNRKKIGQEEFKALLPNLLLLSTLQTTIPLKVLLFEEDEFTLSKNEAAEILDCLKNLYPIALKQPLELPKNLSEGYGAYSVIAPFFEEIDSCLLNHLNALIEELYERF
jgi:hypothetical protein